jgi:hypothetical protein
MELVNKYRKNKYNTPKPSGVQKATQPTQKLIIPDPAIEPIPAQEGEDKRKWEATESAIAFNFCNLVKKIKAHIEEQYPRDTVENINKRIGRNLKFFTINEQYFHYTSIPNYLGGERWYVLCPKCGKKSLKLYLPKSLDRLPKYLCKECHRLKPSSLLLGNRRKYRVVTKPLKRLDIIKKKLLHQRLTPKEADELLEEYVDLENKLVSSPEYRLWKFKKEHGRGP